MHRRRRRRLSVGSNLNQSANHGEATPHKDSREASASLNASYADLGTNDDNEERRDLRKSARRSRRKSFVDMVTPKGRTARRRGSSRSRRRSASPGSALKRRDYTNDQLSAIYRDCILKAQTGKINQQNAWNLHLVDNIEQMVSLNAVNSNVVQVSKSSQQNEFAKASHTIDAASKIYGYRVDSVHNKMYTVLNSIHQQGGEQGVEGGDGDELAAEQNRKRKARNRSLGKSTLCEADKLFKINESIKNLCVEVDPLFHKTASCFDEGGAKGLLMNTLYVQNGVSIVFDSSTKIEQNTLMALDTEESVELDGEKEREESAWMSQLCTESFGEKLVAGLSGMESSVDSTNFSQPMEMACTQADPQHFTVDLDWVDSTAMCPLLELFQNHIDHLNGKARKPNSTTLNHSNAHNHSIKQPHDASPEKNLNQSGMVALHDDGGMDFGGDDDVLMDMPDFTLGGDVSMNAQDLFHEELLTQAVDNGAPNVVQLDRSMGGMSMNMQLADVDPNNLSSAALDASYVVGHANAEIRVGNMGVQPLMNSSWIRDDAVVLEKLKQEQQQMPGLHRQGIYKEGAMNLNAMNDVIAKLEKADFESLTSFFDTKKHGNWAGPDQWYHRRYQLTLNKQKRVGQRSSTSASGSVSSSPSAGGAKEAKSKRARKKKESSQFDFMSIAAGAFVDDAQFEAPQRSFNTLTQAVLDKNRKVYHTLPKDLQIKPDMFIKLFHRPNYSVWKHWLNQHKLRMLKRNEDQRENAKLNGSNVEVGVGGGGNFADEMGLGDDGMDHSMIGDGMEMGQTALMAQNVLKEQNVVAMENIEAMANMAQFAAMAQNGGEDEDEFQYQNPLDASDLKGEFGGELALDEEQFDFNDVLNGYDLIDDPNRKVDKIRVQYAVSAKKVNVRKLKLKLWDRIDGDLKTQHKDVPSEDEDVDMGVVKEKKGKVTFQDSLDSLPANISSSISIHMCFICLLHLANEKELQFVPKKLKMDGEESGMMPVRGDFEIQYADASSAMEMDATKINPVMVLGMQ